MPRCIRLNPPVKHSLVTNCLTVETYKIRNNSFFFPVINITKLLCVVNAVYNWKYKAQQLCYKISSMKVIFSFYVAYTDKSTNRDCIVITFSLTTTSHKPLGRKQPNSTKSFTWNEVVHIIWIFCYRTEKMETVSGVIDKIIPEITPGF